MSARLVHSRRGSRGMSLIETLIVLAIVALLASSIAYGLGAGRQAEVVRATNQLANTIRFAYNKARVTGSYYRLQISLDKGSFTLQRGDDRMYLPATDRYGRVVAIDPGKVKDREERDRRAEENYNRSLQARVLDAVRGPGAGAAAMGQPPAKIGAGVPGQPAAPGKAPAAGGAAQGKAAPSTSTSTSSLDRFVTPAKKVPRRKPPLFEAFEDENSLSELKKPFSFPPEIKVIAVRTAQDIKPITQGEASLFFFPQGHTQLAHIHVQEVEHPENEFTIIVRPLTGRVEVVDGHVELALPEDPTAVRDDLGRRPNRRSF